MEKMKFKQHTVLPQESAVPYTLLLAPCKQQCSPESEQVQLKEEWDVFDEFEVNNDDLWFFDT